MGKEETEVSLQDKVEIVPLNLTLKNGSDQEGDSCDPLRDKKLDNMM